MPSSRLARLKLDRLRCMLTHFSCRYIGEEWKRIWSEENDQVVYEHVETKFVAKTLAETAIGEALADAPSPREEDAVFWKKAWNAERARVVYRHEQSNTEVSSIEVIRVIEAAPAPMEDAKCLLRFHKVWDLETASVHYKDEDSGHVFATVAEAEVWTKLKSSPDAGPDWQTVWSKKHDKVMYRHVASRKRVESADEAIIAGKVRPRSGSPSPSTATFTLCHRIGSRPTRNTATPNTNAARSLLCRSSTHPT